MSVAVLLRVILVLPGVVTVSKETIPVLEDSPASCVPGGVVSKLNSTNCDVSILLTEYVAFTVGAAAPATASISPVSPTAYPVPRLLIVIFVISPLRTLISKVKSVPTPVVAVVATSSALNVTFGESTDAMSINASSLPPVITRSVSVARYPSP